MLGKLLKYDLRYVYKTLGAYYIVAIVAAVIGTLLNKIHHAPFIIDFLGDFLANASLGLAAGIMISTFTRAICSRFRQSLYGDEAYLTHTLPVSRLKLFTAKFISAIITLLISATVVAITMLILFHEHIHLEDLSITIPFTSFTPLYCFAVLTLLVIVQSIFIIMCGFSGIVIGHRFDTARGIISFIAGFGCYFLTGGLLIGLIFLLSNFDPELSALITYGHQPSLPTLINCAWICTAAYATITAILFATNVKLLNRGVNVE